MERNSENKATKRLLASAIFFILFLQIIIMVKFFDVEAVGPAGTSIGCSTINAAFHEYTGVNDFLYDLTIYLGLLAIVAVCVFAFMGLHQLISRRSLIKVDNEILMLGGLYLFIFLLYVLFEVVVVNYRPIVMPGENFPEASFPSSHAVLIVVVMESVMMAVGSYIGKKWLRMVIRVTCAVIMAVTVVGRLFCGYHWLTDIIGGVFISLALMFLFSGLFEKYRSIQLDGKGNIIHE